MSETTIYRFFNNDTGVHFYTASDTEKNYVRQNLSGFLYEGASYQSVDPLIGAGEPLPVYRFLNLETGVHLYTISENERERVANSDNFVYEGEAFFAYETQVAGSIPIYRLYNSATGAHFYTPSVTERNSVDNDLSEFISEGIAYYVLPYNPEAASPQNFYVEIVFGEGTEDFTPEMITAIDEAAAVWENAISQSSFDGEHILAIEIVGTDSGTGEGYFAATASLDPESIELDNNGNFLPTKGRATVNTNDLLIPIFSDNTEYFQEIMTHEFAHVMGFGSLWEINDLIDPLTGVYYADTNAGAVYNSSNNTANLDIPLTTDEGEGSNLVHWQEETFGNELMTHKFEPIGVSNPLSEITLASLEDIGWNVNYDVAEPYPDLSTELAKL